MIQKYEDNERSGPTAGYTPTGVKQDVVPLLKNKALHVFLVVVVLVAVFVS